MKVASYIVRPSSLSKTQDCSQISRRHKLTLPCHHSYWMELTWWTCFTAAIDCFSFIGFFLFFVGALVNFVHICVTLQRQHCSISAPHPTVSCWTFLPHTCCLVRQCLSLNPTLDLAISLHCLLLPQVSSVPQGPMNKSLLYGTHAVRSLRNL